MTLSETELSYIAGFFDGEGSITIRNSYAKNTPRALSPNHSMYASVGNTHPAIPQMLQKNFGGRLCYRMNEKKNHRNMVMWSVSTVQAHAFLSAILPYLVIKKEQAEIAISFQETKKRGPTKVSSEVLKWRIEQKEKIRNLNEMVHIEDEFILSQRVCDGAKSVSLGAEPRQIAAARRVMK